MAFLVLADTAAWWVVTGRMAREAAAWQEAREAEGSVITAGPPYRAGWPLRAELVIPAVSVGTDGPGAPDAVTWQAGDVRLVLSPLSPGKVTVLLDGSQTLLAGAAAPVRFEAGLLDLVVPLTASGQAAGLRLNARALSWPGGGVRTLAVRWTGQAGEVTATGVVLGGGPFGVLDQVHVTAAASMPWPALRDPAAAARAWRDAGGVLTVSGFGVRAQALAVTGAGTLGLDADLQPAGQGTMRVAGFSQAADALVRAGAISASQAQVGVALLSLMARPGPDGALEAELPVRLDDGIAYGGSIPLARVPHLSLP